MPITDQGSTDVPARQNHLLAALPRKEYERLLPHLEEVSLKFDSRIFERGDAIHHVYFPANGIISMLATVGDDSSIIACIVGREGIAGGVPLFLGAKSSPIRAVVQGRGTAMRMTSADFDKACKRGGVLSELIKGFVYTIFVQILQSAVCYRFHPIENRLARWLLMTSDRMETNAFQMTHNFLAEMVGVRREAVTLASGLMRDKNLISYKRGKMKIVDRAGLENVACQCYMLIKSEAEDFRLQCETRSDSPLSMDQRAHR